METINERLRAVAEAIDFGGIKSPKSITEEAWGLILVNLIYALAATSFPGMINALIHLKESNLLSKRDCVELTVNDPLAFVFDTLPSQRKKRAPYASTRRSGIRWTVLVLSFVVTFVIIALDFLFIIAQNDRTFRGSLRSDQLGIGYTRPSTIQSLQLDTSIRTTAIESLNRNGLDVDASIVAYAYEGDEISFHFPQALLILHHGFRGFHVYHRSSGSESSLVASLSIQKTSNTTQFMQLALAEEVCSQMRDTLRESRMTQIMIRNGCIYTEIGVKTPTFGGRDCTIGYIGNEECDDKLFSRWQKQSLVNTWLTAVSVGGRQVEGLDDGSGGGFFSVEWEYKQAIIDEKILLGVSVVILVVSGLLKFLSSDGVVDKLMAYALEGEKLDCAMRPYSKIGSTKLRLDIKSNTYHGHRGYRFEADMLPGLNCARGEFYGVRTESKNYD